MNEYLFVLGRDFKLSVLEIIAYLKRKNINYEIIKVCPRYLLLKVDKISNIIGNLGGCVKIADKISKAGGPQEIEYDLEHINIYEGEKNKIDYGVTFYTHRNSELVVDLLKDIFKELSLKAFLHRSEGIIDPGNDLDLEIIVAKEGIYRVVERSNPREYRERDTKRPKVDPKKVMSIRLAKILINLAMVKDGGTILDPFCGCGTILQEGILMGYRVRGIDVQIGDARANLEWLGKGDYKLWQNEARNATRYLKEIDGVVSEPYLGPYVRKEPSFSEARDYSSELRDLYFRTFYELRKICKGNIVFITPIFKLKGGRGVGVNMGRIIEKLGFEIVNIAEGIKFPLYYEGEVGKIGRQIWVLKRKI